MKYVIMGILALQKLTTFQYNAQMVIVAVFIAGHKLNSHKRFWQNEWYKGFLECTLLGSYLELDFWKQLKVSISTFKYLYILLMHALKKDTKMRPRILVEYRVAIALY
jgi:hypothetical protein